MSKARSWLASRHLERTPEGARALASLSALDPTVRARILDYGDLLAEASVSLAHAYFTVAVTARAAHSGDGDLWQRCAEIVVGDGVTGRNAAAAYFALDPHRLASVSEQARREWCASTARLAVKSQRLAAVFVEALGTSLIESSKEIDPARIVAWQRAAENVLAATRWRGELLASRFLETAISLLPCLSSRAVADWADVLAAIGEVGRTPRPPGVPEALVALDEPAAERALAIVSAIARQDVAIADAMLTRLPSALASLPHAAASALLDAVADVGARRDLADAITLVPAVAHGIDTNDVGALLAHARSVAAGFPAGLAAYLRSMDRALEEGGLDGVAMWVDRGLELGARNATAGLAHFRLESRTSHKILVEHSTAVAFAEIEAVMQRYALMIARRSLHMASGGGTWLRPPLAAPEDQLVRLPERIDLFETSEENQIFYKLAVAHAAARWEYGTYDFSVERLLADGVELGMAPDGDDIVALLDAFPNPLLAAGLFLMLDGARLDGALERDFPGLAADLDRLGRLYARLPIPSADRAPEALIEALFHMSVGRLARAELPARLRTSGRVAESAVSRLRAVGATVYDSVRLLVALYRSLALASAFASRDDDLSTYVEIGGATIIDPLEHLDEHDGPAASASAAGDAPTTQVDVRGEADDAKLRLELSDEDGPPTVGGIPLTPEQIRKLIEQGVDLRIDEGRGENQASLGLYITDLLGKLPADTIERLRELTDAGDASGIRAWLAAERGNEFHFYDEWDHLIGDYRRRWCRLAEFEVEGDGGRYVGGVITRSADLIGRVRREFQLMRPEQFRKVRGMDDGDDFDFNALVDAHADRRTRRTPSDRLYVARRREERDVASLFLLDMSASTDEAVDERQTAGVLRRVIDVTKDTLVVMSAVLHEVGDAYAVYGFSGHGRENVEFYHVKTFNERWGPTVRGRIGGIEPKRSTRMGAALRHAARKLANVSARARHLILLSDGFPQDYDYGDDRRSNVYGIRDTMTALHELESQGVKTFCITVDPAGHDYLKDMCPPARYAVLDDVESLPEELPRIYRSVTRY